MNGTSNYGLLYQKTRAPLMGYVDAEWGGNVDDRRSYNGYAFISWEAHKQKTIALSSTEAEYLALTEATKGAVYLRQLLKEIEFLDQEMDATVIHCDNQGAQKLVRNPIFHSKTKHIDIRQHYVTEIFNKGEIDLKYQPTEEMIVDIFTKGLHGPSHQNFTQGLGIQEVI